MRPTFNSLAFLLLLGAYSLPAHAQDDIHIITEEPVPEPVDQEELVFTIVEEMPVFPGGEEEMMKFLGSNIKYPKEAIVADVSGVVYVTFVVQKDGAIADARVLRGIGGGCDEEALRVVNLMPSWKPGFQRGKPVMVQYNLPIRFSLSDKKGSKKK